MVRRKKSSPLEDVFELVAMLPWWGGVIAAVVLYLGLHVYANQAVAPVTTTAQLVGSVSGTIFRTLAGIFQYILPVICLAAAAASAWKVYRRKSLAQGITASGTASSLDGMTWQEFELLVGEAFRQKGYKVMELGGAGPDGGVDLVLLKGGEQFLVQCKQWKAFKVGVDVVRELYGVMAAKGAAGAFVVTSGKFTADAQEFARGRNVALVDGEKLFAMLRTARAVQGKGSLTPEPHVGVSTRAEPACPACGSVMVKREAKRGANAGHAFGAVLHTPSAEERFKFRTKAMDDEETKIRRNLVMVSGAILASNWLGIQVTGVLEKLLPVSAHIPDTWKFWVLELATLIYLGIRYRFSEDGSNYVTSTAAELDSIRRHRAIEYAQKQTNRFTNVGFESPIFQGELSKLISSLQADRAQIPIGLRPNMLVTLAEQTKSPWVFIVNVGFTWETKGGGATSLEGNQLKVVIEGSAKYYVENVSRLHFLAYTKSSIQYLAPVLLAVLAASILTLKILSLYFG